MSNDSADWERASEDDVTAEVWLDIIRMCPRFREDVANNKHLPLSVLEVLSTDPDERVRSAVVTKRKLTPAILGVLADDSDAGIRGGVARHRRTDLVVLESLARDDDEDVRDAAEDALIGRGLLPPRPQLPDVGDDGSDETGGRGDSRTRPDATPIEYDPRVVALHARWRKEWGDDSSPVGSLVRGGSTWVRFHSLPGSQRYPDTDFEMEIVLYRHRVVLERLAGNANGKLIVFVSWADKDTLSELFSDALAWPDLETTVGASDDGEPSMWVSLQQRSIQDLPPLLRKVAMDELGLVVADETLSWLYAPYDGGADVMARSETERDEIRATFSGWLSPYRGGL